MPGPDELTNSLGPSFQPPRLPGLAVGRRLGRFELLAELGRGGMGVVYRARDLELDREVALKVVLSGHFSTERDARRLRHEAQLAARVTHPGIVTVLDAGVAEGHP